MVNDELDTRYKIGSPIDGQSVMPEVELVNDQVIRSTYPTKVNPNILGISSVRPNADRA